jgi:hypothetical protein
MDGRPYQWLDEYSIMSHELVESVEYTFRGINCEWVDYTVCSRYSQYTSKIILMGTVLLDASAMKNGAYTIDVMFTARVAGHDFKFQGSGLQSLWTLADMVLRHGSLSHFCWSQHPIT